jgi:hypothetical protein
MIDDKQYYYLKEKELIMCDNGEIIDLNKVNKGQKKRLLKECNLTEVGIITNDLKSTELIL